MTKISDEQIDNIETLLDESPEFRKQVRKLLREVGLSGFEEDEEE